MPVVGKLNNFLFTLPDSTLTDLTRICLKIPDRDPIFILASWHNTRCDKQTRDRTIQFYLMIFYQVKHYTILNSSAPRTVWHVLSMHHTFFISESKIRTKVCYILVTVFRNSSRVEYMYIFCQILATIPPGPLSLHALSFLSWIGEFSLTNRISFSWKSGLEHMVWRVVDVCSSVEVLFMDGKQMTWCEALWFHCPITERGVYTIDQLSNMLDSITIHHDRVQATVSDGTWRMGAAKPTQRGCVYPCGSGMSRKIWALLLIPLASILWFGWGLPSCVSFCFGQANCLTKTPQYVDDLRVGPFQTEKNTYWFHSLPSNPPPVSNSNSIFNEETQVE